MKLVLMCSCSECFWCIHTPFDTQIGPSRAFEFILRCKMVTVNYTQDITFLLFPEGRSAFSAHLILINLHRDSAHIRPRRRRARMPWDNAVIDEWCRSADVSVLCFRTARGLWWTSLQHQVGELKVDTDAAQWVLYWCWRHSHRYGYWSHDHVTGALWYLYYFAEIFTNTFTSLTPVIIKWFA